MKNLRNDMASCYQLWHQYTARWIIWTATIVLRFKERDKVGWWIIVKVHKTKFTWRRLFRTRNWILHTKWSYTNGITNFQQGSWNILKIIEDNFVQGKMETNMYSLLLRVYFNSIIIMYESIFTTSHQIVGGCLL